MNLSLFQIKQIVTGAVRVEEIENSIHFYRFTEQQEALYKNRSESSYIRTFATSGIQIRFSTDSKTLFLRTEVERATSRTYFSFEVFVNGLKIGTLDNFSDTDMPADYTTLKLPFGEFSKTFDLGTGDKEVCIYFPWSVKATVKELSVDDGAYIKPIKPGKKMFCFGDSITQGFDALYPSNKYTSMLANVLDSEEYNKAIGGELFYPEFAAAKDDFAPDYITVAYGTNDWCCRTEEKLTRNCKDFFHNLRNSYPNAKIFAITPIWRKDLNDTKTFGKFEGVADVIRSQAIFDNISVIDGFEFVPQREEFFADLRLHPNDDGFGYYFEHLSNCIIEILQRAKD